MSSVHDYNNQTDKKITMGDLHFIVLTLEIHTSQRINMLYSETMMKNDKLPRLI